MSIQIPAFGETNFADTMSNHNTRIVNISDAGEQLFFSYCRLLEENGYEQKEYRGNGTHIYAAYARED